MKGFTDDPFKVMVIIAVGAILGMAGVVGVFLSNYPAFNPFLQKPRPAGWVDDYTYISPSNFTLQDGGTARDIFQFAGAGGQSIIIFSIQVIQLDQKGQLYIRFNGIDLGSTYVEAPGVVEAKIASCCFVSLVQAGVDNMVEIRSDKFEGNFRYIIVIPTRK